MAECRKYLRDEKSKRHAFVAVVPAVPGFNVYACASSIGDTYVNEYHGSPVGFYSTFDAALKDVDGITGDLLDIGYSIAWEAMDSNRNAVPWFEFKMRHFRNVVEPDWFVAAPTLVARRPSSIDAVEKDPFEIAAQMAQAIGSPVHFPSTTTKQGRKAKEEPQIGDAHRARRRKAPWNF